jgi:hypothetical protein
MTASLQSSTQKGIQKYKIPPAKQNRQTDHDIAAQPTV